MKKNFHIPVLLAVRNLIAEHYQDNFHNTDIIIDVLRDKMRVVKDKCSIANAI